MQEKWSVAEINETRLYDANGLRPLSGGIPDSNQHPTICD